MFRSWGAIGSPIFAEIEGGRGQNGTFWVISHGMTHKKIDCSFKTAPVAAIPVNPYFWSKSAEHEVTLTSFVAEL